MVTCGPSLGAHGHGRGRKVLHLFQLEIHPFRQYGQFRHVFFRTSRMTADKVRDDLLAEAGLPVNTIENVLKLPELPERGFTHQLKHTLRRVLRSNLQLTAHMVLTKLPQEKTVFICQQIIKPDTGSDKDLFYLRKFSQLSEKSNVITVVCPEIFAGFREQALFMGCLLYTSPSPRD